MIFLNPSFWIGALVALAAAFFAGKWQESYEVKKRIAVAEAKAEQVEKNWKINAEALEEVKNAEIAAINGRYERALSELRARTARRAEATAPACEGATGRELSRPDAEFLEGFAARCESIRTQLKQHQEWVENVTAH